MTPGLAHCWTAATKQPSLTRAIDLRSIPLSARVREVSRDFLSKHDDYLQNPCWVEAKMRCPEMSLKRPACVLLPRPDWAGPMPDANPSHTTFRSSRTDLQVGDYGREDLPVSCSCSWPSQWRHCHRTCATMVL